MKNIHVFMAALLLFLSFTSNAQQLPATETALKKIICKKWHVEAMDMDGVIIPAPPKRRLNLQFAEDNTCIFSDGDGKPDKTTWKYFAAEGRIGMLRGKEWEKMKIMSVTSSKMRLAFEDEKDATPIMILVPTN